MPPIHEQRASSQISPSLAWGIALIALAAMWVAISWVHVEDFRKTVAGAYDDSEAGANKLANQTTRTLEQITQRLMLVRYLIERDGSADLGALAASGLLGSPGDLVVSVTDADGRILQSTDAAEAKSAGVAERDYFAQARDGDGVAYGVPVPGGARRAWIVPAALRLRGPGGAFAGVVLTGFDPALLTRGYVYDGDRGTVIAVLRGDGTRVSWATHGGQSAGGRLAPAALAGLLQPRDRTGPERGPIDGEPRFSASAAIDGADMFALVSTTGAARLGKHVQLRDTLIWTGAMLSLCILVVAALLAAELKRARRAEALRRHVERSHAAVLNSIPARIALLTAEGRIVTVNDRWPGGARRTFPGEADPPVGHAFLDTCEEALGCPAATLAQIGAGLKDVGSGRARRVGIEYQHPGDGSERWSHLALIDAAVGDGSRHIVAVQWDISERKVAEQALARSAGLNQIAGNVARIGGWIFDVETQVLTLSDELKSLLDIVGDATIAIGDSSDLFVAECREHVVGTFALCSTEGKPFDVEVELVSVRGRRFWARSIGHAVVDPAGKIVLVQGALQDITERKVAELEAAAARAQLRIALDSMTDAFCIVDHDWRFTYINPETEWLLSSSRDALLGSSFWLALPAGARAEVERQLRAPKEAGAPTDVSAFQSPVGAWCEVRAYPCDSGVAIYMRDVTLERRAQQHLRLMEACVDRMNDLVLITQLVAEGADDRRIVFVNEAFITRSGYSSGELLGGSPSLLFGADTDPEAVARIAAAVRARVPIREEIVNYAKSGEKYWLELNIVPVHDDLGEVSHVVAVGRDVTQKKQAVALLANANRDLETRIAARTAQLAITNASIAEKEQEIRSVVEHMADCVISVDHQGQIRSANSMVRTLFGYGPEELVGESLSVLIPGLGETVAAGGPLDQPSGAPAAASTGMHRSGESIAVDVSLSSYTFRDQRRITAIVRDMRDRLQALAELKQARVHAEEASNAKSAFVATMSHEIRTPMSGVIGMIDLLRETRLDIDQSQLVEMARESAHSLMDVVEAVLDFSKIEAGKVEVEHVDLSLHQVIEKTVDLAHSIADKQGVELTLFIDPATPDRVRSDAVKIRQILLNLLCNAIKFSAHRDIQGHVALRVSSSAAADGRATVELAVVDNGIGMDRPTLERLFTSFSQADASTTRRFGGTGLGLMIARELARLLAGEIGVESEPGVGSVFRLRLPLELDAVPAPPAPIEGGCRCLVIGDPSTFADDLKSYLRGIGCSPEDIAADALGDAGDGVVPAAPAVCVFIGGSDGQTVERIRRDGRSALARLPWIAIQDQGPRVPRVHAAGVVVVKRATLTMGKLRTAIQVALDPATVLAPGVPTPPPLPAPKVLRPNALPVLVAEDNEINRHVIEAQLSRLGYRVHLASDGVRALDLLANGDYAMVLTDLQMPKLDGFGLIRAIRAREAEGQRIPVIALTANALKDEAERCLAAGMDGYASKPLAIGTLERLIEKWMPAEPSPRVAGGVDQRPVDFAVMATTIGTEHAIWKDFLGKFKAAAKGLEGAIVAACRRSHWAEAGDLAHQLKSNARTFGSTELGRVCAELEAAADSLEVARIGSLLPELQTRVKEVSTFIDRWSAEAPEAATACHAS